MSAVRAVGRVAPVREETLATADSERDQLLDRLSNLRTILPVFATELAAARRLAAQLRAENHRLTEQVQRLQTTRRTESSPGAHRARMRSRS